MTISQNCDVRYYITSWTLIETDDAVHQFYQTHNNRINLDGMLTSLKSSLLQIKIYMYDKINR